MYRDLQRAGALLLARPGCGNSRISAAQAISPADNFLQKQQKQRERRVTKGRGGNPVGGPRRSRRLMDPRRARRILRYRCRTGKSNQPPAPALGVEGPDDRPYSKDAS